MKKKVMIGLGLAIGIIATPIAMLPTSQSTKAAVLVHDTENIAQAIKEVAQTKAILDNCINQLELLKINTQSLSSDILDKLQIPQEITVGTGFFGGKITMSPEELLKAGQQPSVLNRHKTVTDVLESQIGTIEGVYNGTANYEDLYEQTQRTLKALDATYKDAGEAAKTVQNNDAMLQKKVDSAVEAANNAEGKKEVLQAQVAIAAVNALETRNTNHLLANLTAAIIEDSYAKNIERAKVEKRDQKIRENLSKAVGSNK